MKAALLLVLVAACSDTSSGDLLTFSRYAVQELGPVTDVYVNAEDGQVTVDNQRTLDGTPTDVLRATVLAGPKIELSANCNTAHGQDTTLLVDVHATDGRNQTLVVDVANNGSNACLAQIDVWKDCTDASCDEAPCTGTITPDTTFEFAAKTGGRICVRATAVDASTQIDATNDVHPIVKLGAPGTSDPPRDLETEPQRDAFGRLDQLGADGNTLAIDLHGQDWLVGPYTLEVTTSVSTSSGKLDIGRTFGIDIGDESDVGFELVDPGVATELMRSTWDIRLHHFPPPTCRLGFTPDPNFAGLLEDASSPPGSTSLSYDCTAAHPHYTFKLVPTIDAPGTFAAQLTIDGAPAVTLDTKSRSVAEDITLCSSGGQMKASDIDGVCADFGGTLEIIRSASSASTGCMTPVSGATSGSDYDWRAGTSATLAMPGGLADIFTVATAPPQVWAVDTDGELFQLVKNLAAFTWQGRLSGLKAGEKVISYRMGTSGPPDGFATLFSNGTVELINTTNHMAKTVTLSGLPPLAIGVTRLASGAPILVAVSSSSATAYGIDLYALPVIGGPLSSNDTLQAIGHSNITQMPRGEPTTIEIAGRGIGQQDIVIVFYATEFSTAVTELSVIGTAGSLTLGTIRQYPSANGLAATPEGDVLIALQLGTKLSSLANPETKTILWDPVPPTDPSSTYGRAVTPCLDAGGHTIGFAESLGDGLRVRVAMGGITPQTP